jgi:glycosyltransferase involved in cell wall biosynthesis
MKIALVSDWFLPRIGGLELQLCDLAVQLTKRGHIVDIITGTPGPSEVQGIRVYRVDLGPLLPRLFFRGQELHDLGPLSWRMFRDWSRYRDAWLLHPIDQLIGRGNYDIVHGHSAYSPLAVAACRAAHHLQIPSILSEHSVSKGMGRVLLHSAESLWQWSRWPTVIAGVSNYVAAELHTVTGRATEVLPNGIDPEEWTVEPDCEQPTVVSVMRLTGRKRPLDLVRSIPIVNKELGWKKPPRYVLVGEGPDRNRVEREAERLGVSNQLQLLGRLSRADIKRVLSSATVFALPTRKEALSVATLEALSANVPVVAMGHGGVADIITHGQEGFLARSNRQFSHYIAWILGSPVLRMRLAAHARQAAERFNWERVIGRHIQLYERVSVDREKSRQVESLFV